MKHKKLAVLVLHVYLKQGNINIIVFETALKICFKDTCNPMTVETYRV